jgi:hypothetical protein
VRSCLLDGEAIVSDEDGLAVFELIRSWRHDHAAVLCAGCRSRSASERWISWCGNRLSAGLAKSASAA